MQLSGKLKYWGKIISITTVIQILIQFAGFASGLIIVRMFTKQEYALYTLANIVLGTITVLSDSGINTGVFALAGKNTESPDKVGRILSTGLKLRRSFSFLCLIFAIPLLFYWVIARGENVFTATLIAVSLIPTFLAQTSDSILEIVPRLYQNVIFLQKNQLIVAILRLALSFMFVFFFPFAWIAILATGIPRMYGNLQLSKKVQEKAPYKTTESDEEYRKDIMKIVKRTLPICIYYIISSQITIWILTILGETSSIASFGALSRLTAVFELMKVFFALLIVPRFAVKGDYDYRGLLRIYLFVFIVLASLCGIVLLLVTLFPTKILWILGSNYSGLNYELFLIVLSSLISLSSSILSDVILSRGWVINTVYLVVCNIITLAVCAKFFKLNTLVGSLYYGILVATVNFIIMQGFTVFKFTELKKQLVKSY